MNAPAFPFHEVLAAVGFAVQPGPEPLPAHPSVSAQARSQENEGWRTRGWSFLQARRSSVRRDRAMPAMSRETTQTVPPGPVCCRLGAKGLSSGGAGALVTPVFIVCAPVPSSFFFVIDRPRAKPREPDNTEFGTNPTRQKRGRKSNLLEQSTLFLSILVQMHFQEFKRRVSTRIPSAQKPGVFRLTRISR